MIAKVRKVWRAARREGVGGIAGLLLDRAEAARFDRGYRKWIREYDTWGEERLRELASAAEAMERRPLFSIVMPVYNTDERFLREALESVTGQVYGNWELCVADDASTLPHVRAVIEEFAVRDERILPVFREKNGHISAASNSALEVARGDLVALMDHDDVLAPHALYYLAKAVNERPDAELIYSDEDKIDGAGRRHQPYFKPAWSPELLYSHNYIGHLAAYRRERLESIGGFREGYEGSQDYDLTLRFIEGLDAGKIVHVPRVLYHWRSVPGSVAFDSGDKGYAHERARRAIKEHFERTGESVAVERGAKETHRVRSVGERPSFEVIRTSGPVFDVRDALRLCKKGSAEVVVFITNAAREPEPDAVEELAFLANRAGVGAVGCMISDERGRVVNAGGTILNGSVVRPYAGRSSAASGYAMRLATVGSVQIATAECFAIRREVFIKFGGEAAGFADLCLKLMAAGYRNIWTPWVKVRVDGGKKMDEAPVLPGSEDDPYLSPNLAVEAGRILPAFPPRLDV